MVVDVQSEHIPILRGGKRGRKEGGREGGGREGGREGGMERAIAVCVAVDGMWSVILERFLSIAGRGMKNGENFKLLYDLADKLGAGGIPFFFKQTPPSSSSRTKRAMKK